MRYLVSGGCGFIGSNLVDALIDKGHTVYVVDDMSTGKLDYKNPKAEYWYSSITNKTLMLELTVEVDAIFHVAAWARLMRSIDDPLGTNENNITGTLTLLECARHNKVPKFIFSSSSSVYGEQQEAEMNELMTPRPIHPYALQKWCGEKYIEMYSKLFGLTAISLRYFNVYGFRQVIEGDYALVIGKFLRQKREGKPMTIYGDGEQTRAYCLSKGNKILMGNLKWLDIELIEKGDIVLSYDEQAMGNKRFFRKKKVLRTESFFDEDIYRILTSNGEIVCNGKHKWLMEKRGFRSTEDIYKNQFLYKNQKIRFFSKPEIFVKDEIFYKKGYVAGLMDGDGYFCLTNNKVLFRNAGIAIQDKEPILFLKQILENFCIKAKYSERMNKGKKYYQVSITNKENYNKLLILVGNGLFENDSYLCGYMAGIFDAEGHKDRWQLGITNEDNLILAKIKHILEKFNFAYRENKKSNNNCKVVSITGGYEEFIRFFNLFNPTIRRKYIDLDNREIKGSLAKILSVEKLKKGETLYNIVIEDTHTYIANGFLSHNTHVSDVVHANLLAFEKWKEGYTMVNIGTNQETSVNGIAKMLGGEVEHIIPNPRGKFEEKRKAADFYLAKETLGWEPKVTIGEGIKRLLQDEN